MQVLRAVKSAKEKGFSDVLYLDSINKRYIEEVSSCNIFLVKVHIPNIFISHDQLIFASRDSN